MEGTVKWYKKEKGYGFIQGDDGEDYFAHMSAMAERVLLRKDDRVSFDPADTEKGKQAQNVKLLKKASERNDVDRSRPQRSNTEDAPMDDDEPDQQFDDDEDDSEM